MNPEVKKLWVEALRSGKYQQGKRRLKVEGLPESPRYCCLGVLCDLYRQQTGRGEWAGDGYFKEGNRSSAVELIRQVAEWAELESSDPRIYTTGFSLSSLNDYGFTFSELAEYIEEEL